MKLRTILLLSSLFTTLALADPHPGDPDDGARNKDGSYVTGVLTAVWDPASGDPAKVPIPNSLFFSGTTDLTLNAPVADPTDISDPLVALNALDGFSPTERWVTTFRSDDGITGTPPVPGQINPASVIPGQSVRVFQVNTAQFVAVTGIVRELVPGVDYVAAAAPGGVLAIVPLRPLPEYSDFMAVLTNDITDMAGNNATPDQTYFLSKRRTPWVDANGQSVSPFIDNETAGGLEVLRQLTLSMEFAAAGAGVNPDDIILAWTVHTQSVTPTLKLLRSITQPAPVQALPTGLNTANLGLGLPGLADIIVGIITLPYYHGIPSAQNPIAPLTSWWQAAPGAYIPPFDQFGLDPNSTNITVANPFPVPTGMVTVPFIMGVPNANSGHSKPEGGWPTTIYAHGVTRNRTDVIALMDSLAAAGQAVIAMDFPMHGVVPEVEPGIAAFKIDFHPVFGSQARERTFDVDYFNNQTNQFGPDGVPDRSGQSYFNIGNLLAARDNFRQSQTDLSVLAASLQNISVDGDATPDLNPFNVSFASHSYGVFVGVAFAAVEPLIQRAYINAGGALFLRTAEAGAFGPLIRALLAGAGIQPGTFEFELFMTVGQTVVGSADPASWAGEMAMKMPIINNTVVGDLTVPNGVAGQPMGGNEGLTRLLGLQSYSTSQANPDGVSGVARFLPPAFHESLFRTMDDEDPSVGSPAATFEMQGQMASFLASGGTFVNVGNPDLLVPVVDGSFEILDQVQADPSSKKKKGKSPDNRLLKQRLRRGGNK